ncbi:hypothetical protein D1007_03212 [Hordeum vulgare]|nr:hypothetical protein D1007_03212 [Hordeum vulgare]
MHFVLNFTTEEDKRFVLKAQLWPYKHDEINFPDYDGKGNPAEVNLGVMPIWSYVRDLPLELKTESMATTTSAPPNQLLFKPGVLESLSGVVAARLADANANNNNGFMFNAKKKPLQDNQKGNGRIDRKKIGVEISEKAQEYHK